MDFLKIDDDLINPAMISSIHLGTDDSATIYLAGGRVLEVVEYAKVEKLRFWLLKMHITDLVKVKKPTSSSGLGLIQGSAEGWNS